MKKLTLLLVLSIYISFGAYAQSGAKFSVGLTSVNQDFLGTTNQFTGWNIRLSARLGSRIWFFSPELNYVNYTVFPETSKNPFEDTFRIQTLKIPLGIGWKFKITPRQKIYFKAGGMASYILFIEKNDTVDFNTLADTYFGYYGTIGYDLYWFTIDYRYESSITRNYIDIEDSYLAFHSLNIGINF